MVLGMSASAIASSSCTQLSGVYREVWSRYGPQRREIWLDPTPDQRKGQQRARGRAGGLAALLWGKTMLWGKTIFKCDQPRKQAFKSEGTSHFALEEAQMKTIVAALIGIAPLAGTVAVPAQAMPIAAEAKNSLCSRAQLLQSLL
jgi:hypothetical protein